MFSIIPIAIADYVFTKQYNKNTEIQGNAIQPNKTKRYTLPKNGPKGKQLSLS